jgi:hypothetical protein
LPEGAAAALNAHEQGTAIDIAATPARNSFLLDTGFLLDI